MIEAHLLFPLDQVFALIDINSLHDQAPTPAMAECGDFYPKGQVAFRPGTTEPDTSKMLQDKLNRARGLHLVHSPGRPACLTAGIRDEVCPRIQAEPKACEEDLPGGIEILWISILTRALLRLNNPAKCCLKIILTNERMSLEFTKTGWE